MTARYRVEHDTRYTYATRVSTSKQMAYLRPRALPRQRVHRQELTVEPHPARWTRRTAYFGNAVDQFTLLQPHTELAVSARSLVELLPAQSHPVPELSPPWEDARRALAYRTGVAGGEAVRYAFASPYIALDPEAAEFARSSFAPGRPLLAAAIYLMHRIYTGFRFDPDATTIRTRLLMAFEDAEYEVGEEGRRAALTFAVVGGGPTGVELAGAIKEIAARTIPATGASATVNRPSGEKQRLPA